VAGLSREYLSREFGGLLGVLVGAAFGVVTEQSWGTVWLINGPKLRPESGMGNHSMSSGFTEPARTSGRAEPHTKKGAQLNSFVDAQIQMTTDIQAVDVRM